MPADVKRSWTGAEADPDTRITVARTPRASQGQARWSCVPLGLGEGGSGLRLHGAMLRAPVLGTPSPVLPHTDADFCNGAVSVARITPTLSQSRVRPSGLPIRTMFGAFWRAIRPRSGVGKS